MAVFDRQIEYLKRQLGGLETSQRVALGLCVLVVAAAVLLLTQWSLRPEMVPLVTDIAQDEMDRIEQELSLRGEEFAIQQGTIMVQPKDRQRLMMALVESNINPMVTRTTFEDYMKNMEVFAGEQDKKTQFILTLQSELARTIETSKLFKKADVFITHDMTRKLGPSQAIPKASVQVQMAAGKKLTPELVEALARLVAGPVPGLLPQNVTITDLENGRYYSPNDPEDQFGSTLNEMQRDVEKSLLEKVEKVIGYIPGLMASVTARLDDEAVIKTQNQLDKADPKREVNEEKQSSANSGAAEPGVTANTGVNLTGTGTGQSETESKNEVEYSEQRGSTVTQTNKKPGRLIQANASISIPRSHFTAMLAVLKEENKDLQQSIDELIVSETEKIVKLVKPILMADEEPTVEVTVFTDAGVMGQTAPPSEAGSGEGMMDFVKSNGRQLGLGGLALLALGLMFQVVRKGGEVPAVGPSSSKRTATPIDDLFIDEGPVGRAGTPDTLLVAQETDAGSLQARQVAEEVRTMVGNDPENAARLLRRWIEQNN
ncbi:MAG: hypothetical protein HJJLKODD_01824 [Phycisphaerae bacterium]|nr:hypothetical protein [Phycisphaerae bacterium]